MTNRLNQPVAFAIATLVVTVSAGLPAARADYRDAIGYTELMQALGPGTPTGAGISVTQVETLNEDGHYFPNPGDPELAGMVLTDVTGTSTGSSGHATIVGRHLYGSDTSTAPGITEADVYRADDWLLSDFLKTGSPFSGPPLTESRDIQNHSWISLSYAQATNATRRLDYAIRRDGFTAAVGLNNGSDAPVPHLLAHSYNAICVGLTSGEHSRGTTLFDEPGRVKPDLVVPLSATSWATPVVSAAAALLIETARGTPAWGPAEQPEAVKALLMAGATKDEFPQWERLPVRPLDEVFGAGELNLFNSYLMLTNGPQGEGESALASPSGWATRTQEPGTASRYFFEVPAGHLATELSSMLVWNRHIVDGEPRPNRWDPLPELPDMTLTLRSAEGFVPGGVVDQSTGAVDNVEHVVQHDLPPGRYVFEVETNLETEFALAWRTTLERVVPVVTGLAMEGDGTVRVTTEGVPFTDYALEYALAPGLGWTPIVTNIPTASPFDCFDPVAPSSPGRVYRVEMLGVQ